MNIEELKTNYYQSRTRNKLIAEAFYLTKDIEKYGSGYLRVREAIKVYSTMNFKYSEVGNGYLVELSYEKQKISTSKFDELNEGLNEGLKSLLEIIKQNPGIKAKDIPDLLQNRPLKTIERQISILINNNFIERKGSKKTGGYFTL